MWYRDEDGGSSWCTWRFCFGGDSKMRGENDDKCKCRIGLKPIESA